MPKLTDFLMANPGAQKCDAVLSDISFDSVSTDSRTVGAGQLFFALSGPAFDGHAFVQSALDQGAVAAVISRDIGPVNGTVVIVPDTLQALQAWATHWRAQWPGRLAAVTGSNGKTTVKQMVAKIFAIACGETGAWATPGNLNNHIGVPLSVLGLQPSHQLAVLELGMNHPGEIAALAAIAQPHVALVNNAQREHQEFMKTVEAAAQENGQVLAALPAEGIAIFPRDPQHESIWAGLAAGRKMIRFGLVNMPAADAFSGQEILGEWQPLQADQAQTEESKAGGSQAEESHAERQAQPQRMLSVTFPGQSAVSIELKGVGDHFALNALAAASVAYACGCPVPVIQQALAQFQPVRGRGAQRALAGGGWMIDDTYNANPDSVRAAIDALAGLTPPRALVLGDMGEVGDQGSAFHQEVLRHAQDQRIESLWLFGSAFHLAQQQTGIGRHFADIHSLVTGLTAWIDSQQQQSRWPSIWVKGSRFMQMERVVNSLNTQPIGEPRCC
jgi:UDP-N-acetylmuramyl pentapeptide synthase